jgi:serine/threonine protein phosphatase PrpC
VAVTKDTPSRTTNLDSAKIYSKRDLDAVDRYLFSGGEAVVFTYSAPDKTSGNEDAAALVPLDEYSGVLIVADGVGGSPGGSQASTLAVQTLLHRITHAIEGRSLRETILDGIEAANQAVLNLGTGAATTLAVIEIQRYAIRPYHVGDSLILLTGQRGKVKFQNVPHSPTGYAVESGLMDETDAINHEERSVVSNVVGDTDMRIEIGPTTKMLPRDTLVVASDGLADNLYVDEIVHTIRTGPLPRAGEALIQSSHERMRNPQHRPGHPDDLTFILFRPIPSNVNRSTRKFKTPIP